jgi:hypothetical protein
MNHPLTIHCGVGLALEAWSSVRLVWEVNSRLPTIHKVLPIRPRAPVSYGNLNRVPAKLLEKYPVDVLVIDDSCGEGSKSDRIVDTTPWIHLITKVSPAHQPKLLVHILSPNLVLSLTGRKSKCQCKALERLNYAQHPKIIHNCEVGGAVDQKKLAIIYSSRTSGLDQDLLSRVKWGAVSKAAVDVSPSDESLRNYWPMDAVSNATVEALPGTTLHPLPWSVLGAVSDATVDATPLLTLISSEVGWFTAGPCPTTCAPLESHTQPMQRHVISHRLMPRIRGWSPCLPGQGLGSGLQKGFVDF